MIEKVISGGQTGADIGGVMAAARFGIKTGGWMPLGFLNQSGPHPEFADKYGFVQHQSAKYPPRTYLNVKESDGTIRIAYNFETSGEVCTLKAIQQYKKPFFDVNLNHAPSFKDVVDWVKRHNIKVLNIAGNSESSYSGISGDALEYMSAVFVLMGFVENGK